MTVNIISNMRIYILIIITAVSVVPINAKGSIILRVEKALCSAHDPGAVSNLTCWVKAVNRTTTFINVDFVVTRSVNTLLVQAQVFKKSEVKYLPFLVNITENFCQYMSKNKGSAYLRIATGIFFPYSNMNHKCPFLGHTYVKDLPVDEDKIPQFWFDGHYLLDILMMEENYNKLMTAKIYFETKQRAKIF